MPIRKLLMPARNNITPINEDDPLPYYFWPIVGWFYRRRLEVGVEMLDAPAYPRVLELGYGSGVLLKSLAGLTSDLQAVDTHEGVGSVEEMMRREGIHATLSRGDVLNLNFPDDSFDAVVCFSTLEHVPDTDRALAEINRVLKPGGTAIIGIPAVNLMMSLLFRLLIGIPRIEDQHVADHNKILASCRRNLNVERVRRFPWFSPPGAKLYFVCKGRKLVEPAASGASVRELAAANARAGG